MAVLNPSQIALKAQIEAEAQRQGVDPALASAVGYAESGYNPRATSPAGAQGIMQLMPATAASVGVTNPYDATENIRGGVAYLRQLRDLFPDNPDFQLAAYHAGPGAVRKAGGIPATSDGLSTTRAYVQRIRGIMGQSGLSTPDQQLDAEMAHEIARAKAQTQDDLSPDYLDAKNQQIDDAYQRDLDQALAGYREEVPAPFQPPKDIVGYAGIPIRELTSRLGEDAVQVLGGARDAFVNTMQSLNLLGDWMREQGIGPSGTLRITVPQVGEANTVEGPLIRSVSQFLTAFLPATKLVHGLGLVGQLSSGMVAGAITDFTAFDPAAPRMSNLINDLAPALKNPVTTYLATAPTDSEAEGRLKNALEGLGLGVLTNGLFYAVRSLREVKGLGDRVAAGASTGLTEGGLQAAPLTFARGRATDLFSDEAIERVVQAELTHATAQHAATLEATRTRLAAIQAGDTETIDAVLTQANAVVATNGRVVLGRGATLHRFDTTQEAAQSLTERRLARLETTDPYQPMNAIRRLFAEGDVVEIPTGLEQRLLRPGTGQAATLVDAAIAPDILPYQSMQISGAADALPRTGKTVHVNFDRVNTSDDVKQVIATVSELVRGDAELQRRATMTVGEVAAGAARSPYQDLDRILGLTPGVALNAEDVFAVRQIWVSAADRLHELGQRLATGDRTALEPFLKQYVLTANIHVAATGVRAEAGRALRMFGVDMASTDRQFLDGLMQTLSEANGLPVEAIAARIAQLPSKEQLARFLVDSQRVSKADMFTELWYGALLSNPTTHVVNTLDGMLRTAWSIPERYLSVALSGSNGVSLGEANESLWGLRQGLAEGWSYFAHAVRTGQSQFGAASKVEGGLRPAVTATNVAAQFPGAAGALDKTLLGGFVDLLGTVSRTPGRFLLGADEFFKVVNYRIELHAQAYRRAMQEGLEGEALAQRIVALVEEPLPHLRDKAIAFANYQTLAEPLTQEGAAFESLGRVAQHAVDAREDWLPLKVILPFIRTPFNVARTGAERTPLGLLSSNVRKNLFEDSAEGALARSKMALGSLTMGLFAWMALEGTITGKAPSDPALRDTWQRLGKQEYSIRFGNTYYSYNRFDLFGLPMGLVADFVTIGKETPVHRLETIAGAVMGAIFQNLTSKTYLKGVAEVIEATTPGRGETETQQGQQFERYIAKLAGSVVPSGVAAMARMLDPVQHETRTMLDTILSRLPGYSETVPPRLDLWGRVRLNAEPVGPDLLSPMLSREYVPDRVDEELLRQQVPLTMPDHVVFIVNPAERASTPVELTPQQYRRYVELSAGLGQGMQPLKEAIASLMDSPAYRQLSDGPRGGKSLLVQDLVATYREVARAHLRQEDPAFNDLLVQQQLSSSLGKTQEGVQTLPGLLRSLSIGVR